MSQIAEFKVDVVNLNDKLSSLEKKLAMIIKDHEDLVKDRGSQKSLDFHTQDLSFTECCVYYESIKDTHDVYMVPFVKALNYHYKFLHHPQDTGQSDASYRSAEHILKDCKVKEEVSKFYQKSLQSWRDCQKNLETNKKESNQYLYWQYDPSYNGNPDNQYNYTLPLEFRVSVNSNPWKAIHGIDLCRIYTRETYDLTFNEETQRLFAHYNEIKDYFRAECKLKATHKNADAAQIVYWSNPYETDSAQFACMSSRVINLAIDSWLKHLISKRTTAK